MSDPPTVNERCHPVARLDEADDVINEPDHQDEVLGWTAASGTSQVPRVLKAVVAECFEQGKVQMLAKLSQATEVDENTLARFLHEITVHTNNLNELTLIIKGAQTAALMCG